MFIGCINPYLAVARANSYLDSSFAYPVASLWSHLLQGYLFQDRKWSLYIGFICFFVFVVYSFVENLLC